MSQWLLRIAISIGLTGLVFGMALGTEQNCCRRGTASCSRCSCKHSRGARCLGAGSSEASRIQMAVRAGTAILLPGIAPEKAGGWFVPAVAVGWVTLLMGVALVATVISGTLFPPLAFK